MKVRIINYETDSWILEKFANKLHECLYKLQIDSDISDHPDINADINHHIIYVYYKEKGLKIDTVMITHVDAIDKVHLVKNQLQQLDMGICMSSETQNLLVSAGIPKQKICFVNPAHDDIFHPRKINIGFASRFYSDGRKREYLLKDLASSIDPQIFSFSIMGEGWDDYITIFKKKGFNIKYWNTFNYQEYPGFMTNLDYYLYTGNDEGQIGFVDACASGVRTIVTPQGYHLDAKGGIYRNFLDSKDLIEVFKVIETERKSIIDSVKTWTWDCYAKKHLDIWNYLLYPDRYKIDSKYEYPDGLGSILPNNIDEKVIKYEKSKAFLYKNYLRYNAKKIINYIKARFFKYKKYFPMK
jgi:hypothetical protein